MTSPTRSPVNGPGPTPTPIAVRSWRTSPVSRERAVDERRELLAVLQRPLGDAARTTTSVAVVQGDGDQRGGGVEGEQHQSALQCVVSRPSSWSRCSAKLGGAASQTRGRSSASSGTVEAHAAADEQRPAGERRGAGGVGVADQRRHDVRVPAMTPLERLGVAAAGSAPSARGRGRPAGGAGRRTSAGRRRAAGSSSQASWSATSSPWSIRWPSAGGDQRVEHQEPEVRGLEDLEERAVGRRGRAARGRTPRGRRGCRCRRAAGRARPSSTARASAYSSGSPWSATSPVTSEDVGARVHREQVRRAPRSARARASRRAAEVGVADVRDHERSSAAPGTTARASAGRPG